MTILFDNEPLELEEPTTDFAARDRRGELLPKPEKGFQRFKPPQLNLEPFDVPEDLSAPPESIVRPNVPKSPSLLSRAIKGFRESTKRFNPSIPGIFQGAKKFLTPAFDEGNSPEIASKNKRLQTYTSHMDNVRRELQPLGIQDLWGTPLHEHSGLRHSVLKDESKMDSLEHSFSNALQHIESPVSKKAIGQKLEEIGNLRNELTAHKEEHPDLPPLEMWPEEIKGRKGAVAQYRKEGLSHIENGGDHNSLVRYLMGKYGLAERTAKKHSSATHQHIKDQLRREQENIEKEIDEYMKHVDLPIATEIK